MTNQWKTAPSQIKVLTEIDQTATNKVAISVTTFHSTDLKCMLELGSYRNVKQKWLWARQAALAMTGFITTAATTTTAAAGNPAAPDTLDLSNKPKRQPRLSKQRHDKLQTGTSLTHNKSQGVRARIYLYICMRVVRSLLNECICLSVLAERTRKRKKST